MSIHLPATLRGFIWSVVNLSDDRGSPAWLLLTGNLQAFTQQVFDMLDLVKANHLTNAERTLPPDVRCQLGVDIRDQIEATMVVYDNGMLVIKGNSRKDDLIESKLIFIDALAKLLDRHVESDTLVLSTDPSLIDMFIDIRDMFIGSGLPDPLLG